MLTVSKEIISVLYKKKDKPESPVMKATPVPRYPAMADRAVAVVRSDVGNHRTERRGGAAIVIQAVIPARQEPMAISLCNMQPIGYHEYKKIQWKWLHFTGC